MITTTLNLRGFDNLARRLKTLAATKVKVGFFEEDSYDDGTPVAQVAAWNEYGTSFHPERHSCVRRWKTGRQEEHCSRG